MNVEQMKARVELYVKAAEIMALTAIELLCNDAQKAAHVKNSFHPKMTRAEYVACLNGENA